MTSSQQRLIETVMAEAQRDPRFLAQLQQRLTADLSCPPLGFSAEAVAGVDALPDAPESGEQFAASQVAADALEVLDL